MRMFVLPSRNLEVRHSKGRAPQFRRASCRKNTSDEPANRKKHTINPKSLYTFPFRLGIKISSYEPCCGRLRVASLCASTSQMHLVYPLQAKNQNFSKFKMQRTASNRYSSTTISTSVLIVHCKNEIEVQEIRGPYRPRNRSYLDPTLF